MKASVIVLSIIVLIFASQCWAGSTRSFFVPDADTSMVNGHVKMALHIEAHGTHSCATKSALTIPNFDAIVRNVDTFDGGVDVFMVVFDYDSLTVVEYGLTWPAEWTTAVTSVCVPSALVIGGIVNPGDGIAISWTGDPQCKIPSDHPGGATAPFFIPSYHWLSPTGAGEIVIKDDPDLVNPPQGVTGVSSCGEGAVFAFPEHVYDAGVLMSGGGIYDGPPRFATEPSTWGSIKAMFR